MRETFATVIVWRSYRAVYFYARERACTSMIVAACPPRTQTRAAKNHMYVCVYIYILHIFVARSANITYECLSVRGLKRENSMNIWQISGEGRVLMTVMARCTWWYVIRIRYVRKKTLELAWKLPSPRRINASRYRFPSPPFCQFAIGGRRG